MSWFQASANVRPFSCCLYAQNTTSAATASCFPAHLLHLSRGTNIRTLSGMRGSLCIYLMFCWKCLNDWIFKGGSTGGCLSEVGTRTNGEIFISSAVGRPAWAENRDCRFFIFFPDFRLWSFFVLPMTQRSSLFQRATSDTVFDVPISSATGNWKWEFPELTRATRMWQDARVSAALAGLSTSHWVLKETVSPLFSLLPESSISIRVVFRLILILPSEKIRAPVAVYSRC